jgi:hypothetical protein
MFRLRAGLIVLALASPAAALQVQTQTTTIQIDGLNGPITVQIPPGGLGVGVGGGVAGGQVNVNGQPPRDPGQQPTPTGTSRIRGRVTTTDGNQPLRRATVRLGGLAGPNGQRLATTDQDGRYEFASLPAGRYTVMISKAGYVGTSSKPIDVADNQHADTVNVSVPRGGVIAGRVLDEFGDPVTNAQVMAMRSVFQQGRRQLQPSGGGSQTNDIGEFRIFGLSPGQYYIAANLRSNPQMIVINGVPQAQPDESGYATTYYPGTADSASATRLTIAAEQTISEITVALSPTHLAKITGTAFDSEGRPMPRGNVMASPRSGNFGFGGSNGQIKPDGTFILPNVSPGEYTLRATMPPGPPTGPVAPPTPGNPPPRPETAIANVTVNGADIVDIALYPVKPVKATGRIVFDDMAAAASVKPATIRITTQMVNPQDNIPFPNPNNAPPTAKDDLTFEIMTSPGVVILRASAPPAPPSGGNPAMPWQMKAVMVRGVNVIDTGIEFKPGEDVGDIEIELTNRAQKISGRVLDASGQPAKDFALVLFSQDRSRWTNVTNRYWAVARPLQQPPPQIQAQLQQQMQPQVPGAYQMSSLPPGDYYGLALEQIDIQTASDPDFLESVSRSATPFSLREGETKTLDFRISTR